MNFASKIFNLIKLLFKAKLSFKKPYKKKILIYDKQGSSELLKHLPENNSFILDTRGNEINLRIFLLSILKHNFRWKFFKYLIFFIKEINPDFIITYIDNSFNFYRLKRIFKNSKTIIIQNGIRGYENDIFGMLHENKINFNDFHVDEMLVWNKKTGENYNRFIKGNYEVIGSIKNNRIEINQKEKKYELLFLSEYRNKKGWGINPTWDSYYAAEKKIIPYLYSFAEKKNIKLFICSNTVNYEEEKQFYSKLIKGKNWELLKRLDNDMSYKYLDKSDIVVFITTGLGYEALSRGCKVAAFTTRSETTNIRSHKFGWPYLFEKNSDDFWTNNFDKDKFDEILSNLIQESQYKYKELIKKKYDYLMPFDQGNKILKDKLKILKII